MTKAGGGPQWGGGAKGQMGRRAPKAKARPGQRHAGKPTFGVYNSGGLTNLRWNIVRTHLAPKVDVLGLPEFSSALGEWKGEKFADEARGKLIVGPKPKKGDGSGSAAILLSPRMTACIEEGSEGSCGSRIVYVRLKVGINYLFVICAYIEYWDRGRGKGTEAKGTHRRMQDVIDSQAKTGDCLVVLTDANAKLGPTQDGLAGEYCVSRKPNEAGKACSPSCVGISWSLRTLSSSHGGRNTRSTRAAARLIPAALRTGPTKASAARRHRLTTFWSAQGGSPASRTAVYCGGQLYWLRLLLLILDLLLRIFIFNFLNLVKCQHLSRASTSEKVEFI